MSLLDKAIEYTTELRGDTLLKIYIDELDDTIYYKPLDALTVEKFDIVLAGEKKENIDGLIDILITRALDENGKPAFKKAEKVMLKKRVSPTLIAQIVRQMSDQEGDEIVVKDLEKN